MKKQFIKLSTNYEGTENAYVNVENITCIEVYTDQNVWKIKTKGLIFKKDDCFYSFYRLFCFSRSNFKKFMSARCF